MFFEEVSIVSIFEDLNQTKAVKQFRISFGALKENHSDVFTFQAKKRMMNLKASNVVYLDLEYVS